MINIAKNLYRKLDIEHKFFILFLSIVGLLSLIGIMFFHQYANHIYLFFFSIPTNSLFFIPHEPMILYYGKILHPETVMIVGAMGATVATLFDYFVIEAAFRAKKIEQLKKTKLLDRSIHYFKKMPFITIFMFGVGLLPFLHIIKILVPASKYSKTKYCISFFIGRSIRFYVLAMFGYVLQIPNWLILLIGIVMLIIATYTGTKLIIRRRKRNQNSIPETDDTPCV